MTITEGLQEVKTILKRVEKKRDFVKGYLWRQNHIRDPHEKVGGSRALIEQERQAIKDLENNLVSIRRNIEKANSTTMITISGETKTISEWLVWRRELATSNKRFLEIMYSTIRNARSEASKSGLQVVTAVSNAGANDVIVNIDEKALSDEIENIEVMLSTLDGQLSLKNSTVNI